MPQKSSTVKRVTKKLEPKEKRSARAKLGPGASFWLPVLFSSIFGATLGLSAPGIGVYILAWICVAPLFLLIASSPNIWQAALRGLAFGFAYHLVYLNWFLGLHPLNWLGFLNDWQSIALASLCWILASLHQAVLMAVLALLTRLCPLAGGFLPRKVENKWKLPTLIVLPIIWSFGLEKILNSHDLLGVPWAMIEYSQYKQKAFIQIASIIGGIGISALIFASNSALATLVATLRPKLSWKSMAASSNLAAFTQCLSLALLVSICLVFGLNRLHESSLNKSVSVSVMQANINIEMQKTNHKYTLAELVQHYKRMFEKTQADIIILTESALPTYLRESPRLLAYLESLARTKHSDLIIGAIDSDSAGRPYNSAFGIKADGSFIQEAYHKRFLVPVGEYTPEFLKYLPEFLRRLTDTPAGSGFSPGLKPVVLKLSNARVAPLICFECIAPELVCTSVRNGAELVVNLSDLAWFHNSMLGEQTEASSVFRAIESGRYFVYAANTGPSLFINPQGIIKRKSTQGVESVVTARATLCSEQTPFTQWYH